MDFGQLSATTCWSGTSNIPSTRCAVKSLGRLGSMEACVCVYESCKFDEPWHKCLLNSIDVRDEVEWSLANIHYRLLACSTLGAVRELLPKLRDEVAPRHLWSFLETKRRPRRVSFGQDCLYLHPNDAFMPLQPVP